MINENDAFIAFDNTKTGTIFDDSKHKSFPIKYYNVINGKGITVKRNRSYYGYVYNGDVTIIMKNQPDIKLTDGMYFSISEKFSFATAVKGSVIVIEVLHKKGVYPKTDFKAYTTFGGPIEKKGRLKYIDGCTDSLLIAPVKMGDPCLNHLHFPTKIVQTPHTHPSHRIGIVAKGNGTCITPYGNLPLTKGMIFVIKEWDGVSFATGLDGESYEVGNHCFYTTKETMDVIAFHPDSDFGSTDVNHPMINRTIVKGLSANQIKEIQTK